MHVCLVNKYSDATVNVTACIRWQIDWRTSCTVACSREPIQSLSETDDNSFNSAQSCRSFDVCSVFCFTFAVSSNNRCNCSDMVWAKLWTRLTLCRTLCSENTSFEVTYLQCESKKSSPPKTFCDIFTCGEPV